MSRIEPGIYKARGIEGSVQHGFSKNGTEQIAIDLDLFEIGERRQTFMYFSEKAEAYSLERLRALGWDGTMDETFPGISRNEVMVQIRYETYEGNEQMRVEIMVGGGRVTLQNTMNDQQKRGFMARIARLAKQSGPGPAKADAQPAPAPQQKIAL